MRYINLRLTYLLTYLERNSQNWGALGPRALAALATGAWLTPRNTPLPHLRYPAKFGRSRSSVIKEIRLKNLTRHVPPFNVTQGHRNRQGSIRHL